jgi:hypothetical protein
MSQERQRMFEFTSNVAAGTAGDAGCAARRNGQAIGVCDEMHMPPCHGTFESHPTFMSIGGPPGQVDSFTAAAPGRADLQIGFERRA